MLKRELAIVLSLVIILGAGCAKNKGIGATKKTSDELTAHLASVPLSAELTSTPTLAAACDEDAVVKTLDRPFDQNLLAVPDLWNACQALYACSPLTAQMLTTHFQSGANFQIGYTDLKKFKNTPAGSGISGLYVSHTQNIYLDKTVITPRDACPLLLHELVHRFDVVAQGGEESLRTEYRAFYYQTALLDELIKAPGKLGEDMRAHAGGSGGDAPTTPSGDGRQGPVLIPYHTRESLLAAIAAQYGFTVDSKILRRYKKLPREP